MTIDCAYYNDDIKCYRNGVVERLNKRFKPPKWTLVENTANSAHGYNQININGKMIFRHRIIAFCFLGLENIVTEIIQKDTKQIKPLTKEIIEYEKDKLTLDKFDKFLLQQSRSNISI